MLMLLNVIGIVITCTCNYIANYKSYQIRLDSIQTLKVTFNISVGLFDTIITVQ